MTQHGITLNLNGGINASALKAFTVGASYNYNWNRAETNTQSLAVTPKEGECGYFSFLPHMVTTCGLVANAPDNSDELCPQPKQHYNRVDYGCESDFVDIKTADGDTRHQGATVFVYVDCATNAPLPCGDGSKQDAAYCKDGVALPRSVLLQQLNAMPNATVSGNASATVVESFADPSPTMANATGVAALTITTGEVTTVIPSATQTSPEVTTTGTSTSTR